MNGGNMFYGAAPPPDILDDYISLNGLNALPPGRYLFPKVMEKDKDGTGTGEMGLMIRQFYYIKYKPTLAYVLNENGRGQIQALYNGGIDMTFDQAKIIAKALIEQLESFGFDRETFL
ncbi:MAG: hypothetical protein GY847_33105 [Proteobacteria bacterium]|nr:hypothetical protein [Pseudomonadota bacterium]